MHRHSMPVQELATVHTCARKKSVVLVNHVIYNLTGVGVEANTKILQNGTAQIDAIKDRLLECDHQQQKSEQLMNGRVSHSTPDNNIHVCICKFSFLVDL